MTAWERIDGKTETGGARPSLRQTFAHCTAGLGGFNERCTSYTVLCTMLQPVTFFREHDNVRRELSSRDANNPPYRTINNILHSRYCSATNIHAPSHQSKYVNASPRFPVINVCSRSLLVQTDSSRRDRPRQRPPETKAGESSRTDALGSHGPLGEGSRGCDGRLALLPFPSVHAMPRSRRASHLRTRQAAVTSSSSR